MKKYHYYLALILVFPLQLSAQIQEKMFTLNSTKSSGEADVRISYYVMHDTLFSSRLNDNKKIALADIDFGKRMIKATGSKEDKTTAPVYTIEVVPRPGKSAYKSFGEYAYSYGNDSRDTRAEDAMYVWVGGLEKANELFERFKSLAGSSAVATSSSTGSDISAITNANPFSNPLINLSKTLEEKKSDSPATTNTSDLFSNNLKLSDKPAETETVSPADTAVDMSPLVDLFGGLEADNSKNNNKAPASSPAAVPVSSTALVSTPTAYTPKSTGYPAVSVERQAAAKREILNTVEHVKGIVELMNMTVRLASKSSYEYRKQDFREDQEKALKALNTAKVRYTGDVHESYIMILDKMAKSIKSYEFPSYHVLPK